MPLPNLAVLAALALSPGLQASSSAGECPVELRLEKADVRYPARENEHQLFQSTDLEFSVRPKDENWVLWELEADETSRRAGEKDHPEAFRSFFMRADGDNELRLRFMKNRAPSSKKVAVEGTYKLVRSKKGERLPTQTIEIGKSGSFEAGGIRFEYQSQPGGWEYTDTGTLGWRGHVRLTFPEEKPLALVEVTDENGRILAFPATRSRGSAYFNLFNQQGPLKVTPVLSAGDETFELRVKQEVSLGEVNGRHLESAAPGNEAECLPAQPIPEKQGAECPADVRITQLSMRAHADGDGEYRITDINAYLDLKPLEGQPPFSAGKSRFRIPARDAKGNAMTAVCWILNSYAEKGVLYLALGFDQFPEGDWIELESDLHLFRAQSQRELPPRAIPLGAKGVFEAGGVRVAYAPCRSTRPPSENFTGLSLTFPDNGRISAVTFRGDDGRAIENVSRGASISEGSMYMTFSFPPEVTSPVHAVITLREGIEPCRVPFRLKFGLDGIEKARKK